MLCHRLALAGAFALFAGPVAAAVPPVVENPAAPSEGTFGVEAELVWRVGGFSEDFLFGIVASSAIADDGTTYLLDEQLNEITAIDPAGNEVAKIGREGEGPGEMTGGQRVMTLGDGRVGVLNMRPPKVITYRPDGTPAGDISLAGNEGLNFAADAQANDDRIVVLTKNTSFDEKTQTSTDALRALDPATGEFAEDILVQTEERDRIGDGGRMVIMFGVGFLADWTLFDDGSVAILRDAAAYEIEILDGSGNLVRTIRRDAERVRRPQKDIDDDIAQREALSERAGLTVGEGDVDELEPMIASIHARPNGELWVLPGSGLAPDRDDVLGVFDVFDTEGRFVRQVEVRVPYDRSADRFTLHDDGVIVYEDLMSARGSGFVVMGASILEEEDDETDAEPLAIARYRF